MNIKKTEEGVQGETGVVGKGTGMTVDFNSGISPKVVREDPVFEKNGEWFYWDETWNTSYGPFKNEEEARTKLKKYIELLG